MSIQASQWAWQSSRAAGGALLVLLALASHANEHGEAWPSVATIARLVRLTERQVFKHLRSLLAMGEITEVGAGPRGVKKYRIGGVTPEPEFTPVAEFTPEPEFSPPLNPGSSPPCRGVQVTPELEFTQIVIEPSDEPSGNQSYRPNGHRVSLPSAWKRPAHTIDEEFEAAWWPCVPRKVGKGQALRAYRTARKKTAADVLLSGITRYAAERSGQDPTYTAHPATWLNGERWKDDPAPALSSRRSVFDAIEEIWQ